MVFFVLKKVFDTVDLSILSEMEAYGVSGSIKYLGVHINAHLSWNTYITKISKKVALGIALKHCCPFVPPETLIYAYIW